jgi:hypothetical protein
MELYILYITMVRYLDNTRHYVMKFMSHTGHIGQENLGDYNGLDM